MKLVISGLLIAAAVILLWGGLLFVATAEGWVRSAVAAEGDWVSFERAAAETIDSSTTSNSALVLVEEGSVIEELFSSAGKPFDGDTLFQMASVSKWVTAWGVMKLVEQGKLDLDRPVNEYLTRWKVPDSEYGNRKVTTRRLLSHSAGLTDGLGYGGFESPEAIQSLEESLKKPTDSMSPTDGVTKMGAPADGTWRYSGGGYTVLQLLIEERSAESFNTFMTREVFEPLGMTRSTFVVDLTNESNIAEFYDFDGSLAPHYRYTALAAASLYSSSNDLVKFVQANCLGELGREARQNVISEATLEVMREPVSRWFGLDVWTLGASVYSIGGDEGYVIGHDGGNRPAINTAVRVDPSSCDGIILLTSGGYGTASQLASEWTYWRTGNVRGVDLIMSLWRLQNTFYVGVGLIILILIIVIWGFRKRRG